ncbi:MAG TPA: hypothetical protein PLX15_01200 [Candidatus Woesearchaeota archaeon]|nr:hypothetical protein [Candidatus Woesearchaeota archaeon]
MNKAYKIITNPKVLIFLVVLLFAIVAINPNPFIEGVAIRSITKDSPAYLSGMKGPQPTTPPRAREIITEIDSIKITNMDSYFKAISQIDNNDTILVRTNKGTYTLEEIEISSDGIVKTGLSVYDAPKSNLRLGLDLEGGTRAILKPQAQDNTNESQFSADVDIVIESLKQRLNVYGLSDISVRSAKDLDGSTFITVEIAGANEEEVRTLIAQQGKFEGKIGNKTVFIGGGDIVSVCRTSDCSFAVDPNSGGCTRVGADEYACTFSFRISLSQDAAQRMAEITRGLSVISTPGSRGYLNETLDLYLDDELVDQLRIAAELKGAVSTDISISGPGVGRSAQEAAQDSAKNMKNLQTVLITGSLPVKLEIVKMDSLSPLLGREFISSSLRTALVAAFIVVLMIFLRYRRFETIFPITVILLSEIVITLGFAALVGWNLDLSAIAGIIIAIGSGVDDQIVITDELMGGGRKQTSGYINWKLRIKNAFFIVFAAFATTLVSMIPLFTAGVGLLKGFAFTTIVGISIGVIITRPAFAHMLEILLRKD